ncbi:MAG: chorismate mutase [Spirochaetaceae bacterium]|nr:MAG: chorismate mutase [Spirochaetaceae bacterium]
MIRAVRGAVGIEHNREGEIHAGAQKLIEEILSQNNIAETDLISILFSVTRDLTKGNPATGLRSNGFAEVPLFCVQEAEIEGALPKILRVLVTYGTESNAAPVPVYLGRAVSLRPDLTDPTEGKHGL